MRVGEAIALDRGDFDAALGVIVVRGKLEKIRELPLAPSTTAAVRAYLARRDRPPSPPGSGRCWCPPGGRVVMDHGVEQTFKLLRDRAGIKPRAGIPADTAWAAAHVRDPHDARRATATTSTPARGLVFCPLYLGHVNPASSYWYLQAVPELMTAAATRLERFEERER